MGKGKHVFSELNSSLLIFNAGKHAAVAIKFNTKNRKGIVYCGYVQSVMVGGFSVSPSTLLHPYSSCLLSLPLLPLLPHLSLFSSLHLLVLCHLHLHLLLWVFSFSHLVPSFPEEDKIIIIFSSLTFIGL